MKRVPMDFAWPRNKTWGGYLNPHYAQSTECDQCGGSGYSREAKHLADQWYGKAPFSPRDRGSVPLTIHNPSVRIFAERNCSNSHCGGVEREAARLITMWNTQWCHHLNADDVAALVEAGRLMDFTHTWDKDTATWRLKPDLTPPTPEEVNVWSLKGFGHDAINQWVVVKAECKRLGLPYTCGKCGGKGELWPSPEIEQAAEEWIKTEPPTGDGYQLWETTSEGSPVSPVFATIEELCEWCADHATVFGRATATAAEWRGMLEADFVHHSEGNAIFI